MSNTTQSVTDNIESTNSNINTDDVVIAVNDTSIGDVPITALGIDDLRVIKTRKTEGHICVRYGAQLLY